jgi:DNA-binding XRE family transcriptional regulator
MTLQKIRSLDGKDEYVLLPISVYRTLRAEINSQIAGRKTTRSKTADYVPFELEDYVDNPIALARIRARLTQAELAKRMSVTQAYISKIEAQDRVSSKVLEKAQVALALRAEAKAVQKKRRAA